MNVLQRLSKRAFSNTTQQLIKQELTPTITRLDHASLNEQYSNRKSFRGPLKAAILDWSGTTADAHVLAPAVVFCEVFEKHGVPITMKEARGPMGLRKDLHIAKILEIPEVRERWINTKNEEPTQKTVDLLFKDFVPMQIAVLPQYTGLLPGCADTVNTLKNEYNLKIGSTTGFVKDMVDVLLSDAAKQGYVPDSSVAGDEVENNLGFRPAPFMLYKNLLNLGIWPIESVVKADDTISGVGEGLNAGCWSVGIYGWSNYTDIDSMEQWNNMNEKEQNERRMISKNKLINESGAHYVIETINDLPSVVADINERLKLGESPMNNYLGQKEGKLN
eukprot:184834_1